ncbi:MAG: endonuclease/exonuclease/phosphatase family protein [Hyphomicrobiales bacterium]
MKIMSLNGWGGRLGEALIAYVTAMDPDVLCLQEVVHTPASQKDWLSYRDNGSELPQRANFFNEVSQSLPHHRAVFCPAAQGDLWDGDARVASQWGLATFIRDSMPIIAQHQGFVHGRFSADCYGGHPRSRNAHAVRVFDFARQIPVVIAHMHGLRDLAGKHDTPERFLQARKLVNLVQSVAEPGDPIIVCGDFNVLPDSETFKVLGTLGLTNLVQDTGSEGTRTSHYAKPGRFADYMLVNSAVGVSSFEIVRDPEISDHCPLVLEFDQQLKDTYD